MHLKYRHKPPGTHFSLETARISEMSVLQPTSTRYHNWKKNHQHNRWELFTMLVK